MGFSDLLVVSGGVDRVIVYLGRPYDEPTVMLDGRLYGGADAVRYLTGSVGLSVEEAKEYISCLPVVLE